MWSGFKQGRKASLYYSNSAERILRRVRILGRAKSKQGYKANLPINFVFIQNAPLMLQKKLWVVYYSNSAERILSRVRILGRSKSKQGYKANLPTIFLINFVFIKNAPHMLQKKLWVVCLCVLVQFALEAFMFWHFGGCIDDLLNAQFWIYSKRPPPASKKTAPIFYLFKTPPLILQKKRLLSPRSP